MPKISYNDHMKRENLAKNTFFYTVALALQKVLSFAYIVFLARAIGVEDMGRLGFALSFTTIFAIFLDFGLTQILIKESAKNKEESQKYLSSAISLKIIGAVVVYGLVFLFINIMNYPPLVKNMVYLAGVVMVFDSFTLSMYGIFRGHHNLKFESLGTIINQLLVITAGVLVVKFDLGMVALVGAYLVGAIFNFIFASSFLRYGLKILTTIKFDWQMTKRILWLSLPFAIAGIFGRIYSNIDMVMLSKMTTDYEVGLYSIAYKVAFAVQFIGMASLATLYPAFCSYFVESKELLAKSFERSVQYLLILSLPLAVGVIAISDKIIGPMFGADYNQSVLALQIMMISIPLAFLTYPLGAMLNACNKQATNTTILGVTAGVNIILNLAFIPLWGHVGSAVAVPLSYLVIFLAGLFFVSRIIKFNKKFVLLSFGRILFSSVVMGVVVMFLKERYHFVVPIVIGSLVYIILLYALREVTRVDINQIKTLLFKKAK